jgi:hypothetical protein
LIFPRFKLQVQTLFPIYFCYSQIQVSLSIHVFSLRCTGHEALKGALLVSVLLAVAVIAMALARAYKKSRSPLHPFPAAPPPAHSQVTRHESS